jgi:hypothetical protein
MRTVPDPTAIWRGITIALVAKHSVLSNAA